uniref:Uncharacterized protein MAL13P1.336-like n=1 Tax=Diabrotica virgifera virgifera TaxID=50390 RepID=A0A6P7G6R0_DIAVI
MPEARNKSKGNKKQEKNSEKEKHLEQGEHSDQEDILDTTIMETEKRELDRRQNNRRDYTRRDFNPRRENENRENGKGNYEQRNRQWMDINRDNQNRNTTRTNQENRNNVRQMNRDIEKTETDPTDQEKIEESNTFNQPHSAAIPFPQTSEAISSNPLAPLPLDITAENSNKTDTLPQFSETTISTNLTNKTSSSTSVTTNESAPVLPNVIKPQHLSENSNSTCENASSSMKRSIVIDNVQGSPDTISVVKEFTTNMTGLLNLLQSSYQYANDRSTKTKFTKLQKKLVNHLGKDISDLDSDSSVDNCSVSSNSESVNNIQLDTSMEH